MRFSFQVAGIWLLWMVLFCGCKQQRNLPEGAITSIPTRVESGPAWFQDVTDEVGLNFVHDSGPSDAYFMPKLTGGGAAFLDVDNDGRLDILLLQNAGPASPNKNKLFRQAKDGRFEDISFGSGLDVSGYAQGVAVGDVNNDGRQDVFITEYGAVRLFLNQQDGKFLDQTKASGIDNPLWGTSSAFVDIDRDGFLDLVIVNYIEYNQDKACALRGGERDFCGPSAFTGEVTKLYRNLGTADSNYGETVRFEDITLSSGLASQTGPGLGVACADFSGDGWPDIFVANDGAANHLWINQQNGTFVEEGVLRGVATNAMGQSEANMGVAIGDVDGDGNFDIFVTHLHEESHRLWKQSPRGMFTDQTPSVGLISGSSKSTGFGTLLADFDLDGGMDLVVVNGMVRRDEDVPPDTKEFWSPYRQRNQLYANDSRGKFRNRSEAEKALCGVKGVWRAVVCGDVNNDGALDLLVTRLDGSARLFKNVAHPRGHWLVVQALDPIRRRHAYGAEVTVVAGKSKWSRTISPEQGYASSSSPRAHFGLGEVARIDEVVVRWPNGQEERFQEYEIDRVLTLYQDQASPAQSTRR